MRSNLFSGGSKATLGEKSMKLVLKDSPETKKEFVFEIPQGTVALNFTVSSNSAKSNVILKNPELRRRN